MIVKKLKFTVVCVARGTGSDSVYKIIVQSNQGKGRQRSRYFFEKVTEKLLLDGAVPARRPRTDATKVFSFFFSKKKPLLNVLKRRRQQCRVEHQDDYGDDPS
jgi:hypothetical protein